MFCGLRQRESRNREVHRIAAADIEYTAVHQNYAKLEQVPPRVPIAEAAGAAGVSCDRAADCGGCLGGVRRIELAGAGGGRMEISQQDTGSGDGASFLNLQTIELFE